MKQIFKTLAVAFAFVAAASCAKEDANPAEDQPSVKLVPTTIEASIDATKATVGSDGKVTWQENDAIAVWVDGAKYEMTLTAGADTKEGTFKGELPEGGKISAAVSPASAATATPGVPAPVFTQTIVSGATCDPAALIMTASAPVDQALSFKNACGAGRFTLPGNGFSKIMVYCAEGKVEVNLPGTAGTFDVFLPVATYTNILVAATTVTGVTYGVQLPKDLVVKRSVITNLGTLAGEPCAVITSAGELQEYLSAPATNAFIVKDINLADVELTPCESLEYTLDGMGHSLKNWVCKKAMVTSLKGSILNLTVDSSCQIQPDNRFDMGALVSIATEGSVVKGCVNKVDITIDDEDGAQSVMGSLVGRSNKGLIQDCVNEGDITFTLGGLAGTQYIGGILGMNGSPSAGVLRVKDCVNKGNVTITVNGATGKNCFIGGVVGASGANAVTADASTKNYGIIEGCQNSGKMTFNHPNGGSSIYMQVGGVIGYFEGQLKGCTNDGDVDLQNSYTTATARPAIGGVCGSLSISAENCVNNGNINVKGIFANGTATASGAAGIITSSFGGVFGNVGNGAIADDCKLTGCVNNGSLTIDATMPSGNKSTHRVGGVVAQSYAVIDGCSNTGDIDATLGSYGQGVGGIAGYTFSSVANCQNSGKVQVKGVAGFTENQAYQFYIAGIAGNMASATATTMTNCQNSADVTVENIANKVYSYIGSFMGNYAKQVHMTECHAKNNVVSTAATGIRIGGLAGAINGTIDKCSFEGNIDMLNGTALDAKESSGGLCAGYNNGAIKNSSFKGAITSTSAAGSSVGGLLGNTGSSAADRNVYATVLEATIVSGDSTVGAVVGRFNGNTVYCYLGTETEPLVIKSTTINGTPVTSTDPSVLIGNSKDSPNVSIVNVQIQ